MRGKIKPPRRGAVPSAGLPPRAARANFRARLRSARRRTTENRPAGCPSPRPTAPRARRRNLRADRQRTRRPRGIERFQNELHQKTGLTALVHAAAQSETNPAPARENRIAALLPMPRQGQPVVHRRGGQLEQLSRGRSARRATAPRSRSTKHGAAFPRPRPPCGPRVPLRARARGPPAQRLRLGGGRIPPLQQRVAQVPQRGRTQNAPVRDAPRGRIFQHRQRLAITQIASSISRATRSCAARGFG